ncbi:Moea2p, partial [Friedmanniomyces endolithicus]
MQREFSRAAILRAPADQAIYDPTAPDARPLVGRVLARDLVSPINVPAHDNSAMDGYALRGGDLPLEGTVTLKVVGVAYAGKPLDITPGPGECVRIMTGGVMPAGCDSVLPQEFAESTTIDT